MLERDAYFQLWKVRKYLSATLSRFGTHAIVPSRKSNTLALNSACEIDEK